MIISILIDMVISDYLKTTFYNDKKWDLCVIKKKTYNTVVVIPMLFS